MTDEALDIEATSADIAAELGLTKPDAEVAAAPTQSSALKASSPGAEASVSAAVDTKAKPASPTTLTSVTGKPASATVAPETLPPNKTETAVAVASALPAPKTWQKEAAGEWGKLPPIVQQEIAKREKDIFDGIEQYRGGHQFAVAAQNVLKPFLPAMQATGVQPLALVQDLVTRWHTFTTGNINQRAESITRLAREFGLNITVEGAAPQEEVHPQVARLQQELQATKLSVEQMVGSQRERSVQDWTQRVQAFAEDPAHPHFMEVMPDIQKLLQSGMCKSLEEAYPQAVLLNPVTRAKEQERIAKEAREAAAKQVQADSEAARNATAANVKSAQKARGTAAPTGSLDDTLNETMSRIKARGSS